MKGHKYLLALSALADQNVIGKGLGNAVGCVLIGQIRCALNIDDLDRNKIRSLDGGPDRIHRLLRTIRTGGADKHLHPSGRIDLLQHF